MHNSLHDLLIPTDNGSSGTALQDFSTESVFFRRLPERMAELIGEYPYVVGCVAWLTHPLVLDALALCKGVSIIVQKEDFLRPDGPTHAKDLRRRYRRIPGICRYEFEGTIHLSSLENPESEAIRCVGNHNIDRNPAHPRSHHKFLVFYDMPHPMPRSYRMTIPKAVWTGSFNPTNNGGKSFENAVLLTEESAIEAFANEWAQVFALSEPLDWETPWASPEYRIGT